MPQVLINGSFKFVAPLIPFTTNRLVPFQSTVKCKGLVINPKMNQPKQTMLIGCTNYTITNFEFCPACFFKTQHNIKSKL